VFVELVLTGGLMSVYTQSFLVPTQSRRLKPAQQRQTKVYATNFPHSANIWLIRIAVII